ncbi:hypothetical protein QWY74_12455 [Halomonas almeriensis]|uniref:hypothetical protein n=1 Tax=Halomonas almeriensis TaxID=308163 RepID=UPI0025B613BB|nr:hypothetical protein [Halomonas almeriensis]MDN3554259.1 hypothetical protein [Halomonas almeriensis]
MSLYRYGLYGKGAVYNRLKNNGFGYLYNSNKAEDFEKWFDFLSSDENIPFFGEGFDKFPCLSNILGFFSFRLLSLAFRDINKALEGVEDKKGVVDSISKKSIVNFVVRNENLEEDFLKVLEIASSDIRVNPVSLKKSVEEIREEIHERKRVNVTKVDKIYFVDSQHRDYLKSKVCKKEWVYGYFGYPEYL